MRGVGVKNLRWMDAIAAYVLPENVVPRGARGSCLSWGTGPALVGWGAWLSKLARSALFERRHAVAVYPVPVDFVAEAR